MTIAAPVRQAVVYRKRVARLQPEGPPMACGHPAPCGCSRVAMCCLECPLPVCVFELPSAPRNAVRDAEIVRRRHRGDGPREVAADMGISLRTVHRVMQGQRAS